MNGRNKMDNIIKMKNIKFKFNWKWKWKFR